MYQDEYNYLQQVIRVEKLVGLSPLRTRIT